MLEELQRVIERQDSFRFFSSSLLIIYDGAECAGVNGVSVRGRQSGRVRVDTGETRTNGNATPPLINHTHSDFNNLPTCHGCNFEQTRKHVDIRMIDFGRTSHTGINDTVRYTGPDTGYLFGLHSVLESFRQILV